MCDVLEVIEFKVFMLCMKCIDSMWCIRVFYDISITIYSYYYKRQADKKILMIIMSIFAHKPVIYKLVNQKYIKFTKKKNCLIAFGIYYNLDGICTLFVFFILCWFHYYFVIHYR